MKYTLILISLIICSCNLLQAKPFVIGDCIQFNDSDQESWESPRAIKKVVRIGHRSILTYDQSNYCSSQKKNYKNAEVCYDVLSFQYLEFYNKVLCPR